MKILSSLMLVLFLLGSSLANAQTPDPYQGQVLNFGSFCKDEESAKGLSHAVTRDGDEGYGRFMRQLDNHCYDSRISPGVPIVQSTLFEKVWTVNHANGDIYEFWTAMDGRGQLAYVWVLTYSPPDNIGDPA